MKDISNSLQIFFSGPLFVPIQITLKPSFMNFWATLLAGNTCPPVPPAAMNIVFGLDT